MSFFVSNFQNKRFVPIVTPFTGTGTDDLAGGYNAPPGVDWHCVPANLNLLHGSVAAPSGFVGGTSIQPRLGGVDTGSPLVLPLISHSVTGAVSMVIPPVAVLADLDTNKFGVHVGNTIANERIAWVLKFDPPFDAWQLVATGFPASAQAGKSDNGTTQHQAPFSFSILAQADVSTTPWPLPGTFKYMLMVTMTDPLVVDNPVFEGGIEVNGADSALLLTTPVVTVANLTNLIVDTANAVHVNAGDLVQFVFRRPDAGGFQALSGTRMYFSVGFLPD